MTDDGIDDGSVSPVHADFYQFGNKANPDRLIYNYDWTSDPSAAGTKGHGNLNASIVAGYNNLSGAAYEDRQGYNYGLGINPFGRVAGSKVFSSVWGWDLPNSDFRALVSNTYLSGARISTNSWGSTSYGSYTWDDQTYDALVRDAVRTQPGNQEIIVIIFSAGNNGPWPAPPARQAMQKMCSRLVQQKAIALPGPMAVGSVLRVQIMPMTSQIFPAAAPQPTGG